MPGKVKRLANSFKNRGGKSQRVENKKFNICKQTISNYSHRNGIRYLKKKKAPLVTDKQLSKIITASRKLATKIFVEKTVVIDDEKYFTLANSELSGNSVYYTDNKRSAPKDVRFKKKS